MFNPTKPYVQNKSAYKEKILKLIQKTWSTPYVSVKNQIIKKKFLLREYGHTDGIGTKGIYHWKRKTFKNAVLDALAMNLNDLLVVNAKPYALLNHLFLPKDDRKAVLEIISHLSNECKKRKIAIIGGETAINNDIAGLELSVSMFGFVEKIRENRFKIGDALIGIESNGLHSNGFSKIRQIYGSNFKKEFIRPTLIYPDNFFNLGQKFDINGMVHITGGAFTKLKEVLPRNANIYLRKSSILKPQAIFYEIYKKGVPATQMYKIFNCGIGLVFSVKPEAAGQVLSKIKNFKADIIGEAVPGSGKVIIESAFSNKKIIL